MELKQKVFRHFPTRSLQKGVVTGGYLVWIDGCHPSPPPRILRKKKTGNAKKSTTHKPFLGGFQTKTRPTTTRTLIVFQDKRQPSFRKVGTNLSSEALTKDKVKPAMMT